MTSRKRTKDFEFLYEIFYQKLIFQFVGSLNGFFLAKTKCVVAFCNNKQTYPTLKMLAPLISFLQRTVPFTLPLQSKVWLFTLLDWYGIWRFIWYFWNLFAWLCKIPQTLHTPAVIHLGMSILETNIDFARSIFSNLKHRSSKKIVS